jgi:hypothetical protein
VSTEQPRALDRVSWPPLLAGPIPASVTLGLHVFRLTA